MIPKMMHKKKFPKDHGLNPGDITDYETAAKSIEFCDQFSNQLEEKIAFYGAECDLDNRNRCKDLQKECMKFSLSMKSSVENGRVSMDDYLNLLQVQIIKDSKLIKLWKDLGFGDAYEFCKNRYLIM